MSVLKLKGNDSGTGTVTLEAPNTNTDQTIAIPDGAGSFVTANASGDVAVTGDLTVDTDTLYVDAANNRVGIGTSSPTSKLQIRQGNNSNTAGIRVDENTAGNVYGALSASGTNTISLTAGSASSDSTTLRFLTASSGTEAEAMRIDSSGNLLVHKTSPDQAVEGMEFAASNYLLCTKSGGTTAYFNRTTSDGSIAEFRKDGTTVGSLGTEGTYLHIEGSTAGAYGLKFVGSSYIRPSKNNGLTSDNELDLGTPTARFDDIYATNGTIQTSDRNEKQQIASLTDAEITAAKAISKLFKTFKWNDKVAEKGDAARTHAGVIAQDVQQAMIDAGLDAGNYAFFISSTWWEADETYTDDDGVEQTRTNSYATAEEAPEGATERTRLGIRYPELLSFIGAATEQRLASIETRLDALEAV